ncbi:hypothetical protein Dred_3259 [Desulforamulus reducens MI-1]|uniref:DUF2062 domain-containing protein n=1 Tax=Desulforamulus reducens (strain ATCC BAA-1160 / DSM 100696 / MI-1) TaxID=349161 RepID=A4J9K6_DESRM|nr:DUF2062 domain-containing protein [Desulforamulus reducens]ABO51759.1 hypothetical protein Dred_3259 [Desulforamulus reducens MI-1]
MSKIINQIKEAYKKILSTKGSPKEIALGVAIPIGIEFLPIPLINIPVALAISKIFRANVIITGVVSIAIKPFFPLFVSFNFFVAKLLFSHFKLPKRMMKIFGIFEGYGYKYLTASLFDCIIMAVISYFIIYNLLKKYRKNQTKE